MSLSATHASRPATLATARSNGPVLRRIMDGVAREWHSFRAARALDALDDRSLNDIGVSRALIEHVVRHGRPPAD